MKILSTVPHDKGFYFYTDLGRNTGETATNLETFAQKLETINADSIKFHFQRRDYQNWIKTTVGDDVLADRINHIGWQLPVEDLRKELVKTVQTRIAQLKLLHSEIIISKYAYSPIKYASSWTFFLFVNSGFYFRIVRFCRIMSIFVK